MSTIAPSSEHTLAANSHPISLQATPETPLLTTNELEAPRDIWTYFSELKLEYLNTLSPTIAKQLEALIGTSSSYDKILAAMAALFDASYYLSENTDVADASKDGSDHYLLFGWKEGRDPTILFSSGFYKNKNPQIRPDEFPLLHFFENGYLSGIPANPISNKFWHAPSLPKLEQWSHATPAKMNELTETVVIIPVYKGYEESILSIYQAIVSRNGSNYSVLVVNDKSPDDRLNTKLKELNDLGLFNYHINSENIGFVKTCNTALESLTADRDIILLNSDAYVFPGWYQRLRRHAGAPEVATVTPLSNNATICSYPVSNLNNRLALECSPDRLDQIAATANHGLSVETPTGVGFCLFIKRKIINQIGLFDEKSFEIGYGEENDFCMRALNAGYKNLVAGDVFVFHTGSVSFSTTKANNYQKGQEALTRKHPNYAGLVRSHIVADPERRLRLRIDAQRLSAGLRHATVFITHRWSGGIETFIRNQQAKLTHSNQRFLTISVHDTHRASIDSNGQLFLPNLTNLDLRKDFDLLSDLLIELDPERYHVNSFAGLDWYWHKRILYFLEKSNTSITYVAHDYSSISHNYHLLRPDNIYTPPPSVEERKSWLLMHDTSSAMDICDPEERVYAYDQFFSRVDIIKTPSNAAKVILEKEFPSRHFNVVPHINHLPHVQAVASRPKNQRIRICAIGAIGPHKGSEVLTALAAQAQDEKLNLEYHLVGYSNDDELLRDCGVQITGAYLSESEAIDHILAISPDLILIPSIWNETFCYTLSIALALKIPPVVFDIGAQAERVSELRWGVKLPIAHACNPRRISEALLNLDIEALWAERGNIAAEAPQGTVPEIGHAQSS